MVGLVWVMFVVVAVSSVISGSRSARAAGNALIFAYNAATVTQTANSAVDAGVDSFEIDYLVSRYNRVGNTAVDKYYVQVEFKNASNTVLFTYRNPTTGWANLSGSNAYLNVSVSVGRANVADFASIAKVTVTLGGDDGEFWNGNYGPRFARMSVKKVSSGVGTEILTNPTFDSSSGWTSSTGTFVTCSASLANSPCVGPEDYHGQDGGTTSLLATTTTLPPSTTTTTTVPATTTTVAPTTTLPPTTTTVASTTTIPATTTTVAPTTTVPVSSSSSTPSPASTQVSLPDISQAVTPVTAPVANVPAASTPAATAPVTTTTTVPPPSSTTATRSVAPATTSTTTTVPVTTTTVAVPVAPIPADEVGAAGAEPFAVINGARVNVKRTVSSEGVRLSVASVNVLISASSADGSPMLPDDDGVYRVTDGDSLVIAGDGFGESSMVDVWVYSDPQHLATLPADAAGAMTYTLKVSDAIPNGDHHLVLKGVTDADRDVTVAVSFTRNGPSEASRVRSMIVWVAIVIALSVGLLLPSRRRRENIGR